MTTRLVLNSTLLFVLFGGWSVAQSLQPLASKTEGIEAYRLLDHASQPLGYLFLFSQDQIAAQLIDQPLSNSQTAPTLQKIGEQENALLVVNGGYFTRSFAPDGLFRLNKKELAPLSHKGVLSGAVQIDQGKLKLLPRKEIKAQPNLMQTGPFLIDPGGKLGIRSKGPQAERTVLALLPASQPDRSPDVAVMVIREKLSLLETAKILHGLDLEGRKIERALNLDGGPSTGFYAPAIPQESFEPKWPVRNMVVFKPKG